jgi:hypothetical protein
MQPSRRHCLYALFVAVTVLWAAPRTLADRLTITSSPAGATVEIDGKDCGITPYQADLPGGYFHKTHTVFGSRLEHALVVKISKRGYVSQQLTLTVGPYNWLSVTGRSHGIYYLLKSGHFDVKLDPAALESDSVDTVGAEGPMNPSPGFVASEKDQLNSRDAGSVLVNSDPSGAEIYIDGKFAGQTPSTIRLPSGTHRIVVKAPGKEEWQRNLEVWQGSQLTLHPVLTQQNQ